MTMWREADVKSLLLSQMKDVSIGKVWNRS